MLLRVHDAGCKVSPELLRAYWVMDACSGTGTQRLQACSSTALSSARVGQERLSSKQRACASERQTRVSEGHTSPSRCASQLASHTRSTAGHRTEWMCSALHGRRALTPRRPVVLACRVSTCARALPRASSSGECSLSARPWALRAFRCARVGAAGSSAARDCRAGVVLRLFRRPLPRTACSSGPGAGLSRQPAAGWHRRMSSHRRRPSSSRSRTACSARSIAVVDVELPYMGADNMRSHAASLGLLRSQQPCPAACMPGGTECS